MSCARKKRRVAALLTLFWLLRACSQGKTGKLLSIKGGKVVVEGVNMRTKHVKPMKEGETGQLDKRERPIHASNVALSDEQPAAAAPAAE